MDLKSKKENREGLELFCADKNVCSINCLPKEDSKFKCNCGGSY